MSGDVCTSSNLTYHVILLQLPAHLTKKHVTKMQELNSISIYAARICVHKHAHIYFQQMGRQGQ